MSSGGGFIGGDQTLAGFGHHHNVASRQFQCGNSGSLQSSVNEMLLEQLEQFKYETETVVAKMTTTTPTSIDKQQANDLPPMMCALLDTPRVTKTTVQKVVPTLRACLARRNIILKEKIGSGSYSKVRSALRLSVPPNTSTPLHPRDLKIEKIAVKIVDRRRAPKDYQQRFMPREVDIWATLRHPNIIRLHDVFGDPLDRFVCMVSEFAEGGDCLGYVQRVGSLNEATASSWVAQVCYGTRYMHSKGVCHRDLKLENLFLDPSATTVKIGDLGFARRFTNSAKELSQTYCGSKSYAAPEILKGVPHDAKKSDCWAIGIIAYILLTGKMPFDESRSNKQIVDDQKSLNGLQWGRFANISTTAKLFINQALTFPFNKRPAISAFLKHDWLLPHCEMIGQELASASGQMLAPSFNCVKTAQPNRRVETRAAKQTEQQQQRFLPHQLGQSAMVFQPCSTPISRVFVPDIRMAPGAVESLHHDAFRQAGAAFGNPFYSGGENNNLSSQQFVGGFDESRFNSSDPTAVYSPPSLSSNIPAGFNRHLERMSKAAAMANVTMAPSHPSNDNKIRPPAGSLRLNQQQLFGGFHLS